MHTPIYEFLTRYAAQDPLRMHMPGHKAGDWAALWTLPSPWTLRRFPGRTACLMPPGS